MTTVTPMSPDQIARAKTLADEAHDLSARKTELDARLSLIKDELAALLPFGTYTDLGVEVKRPNRVFSEETARQVLPPDLFALLTVEKVDKKKARELLGDDYDRFMVPGEGSGSVVIK